MAAAKCRRLAPTDAPDKVTSAKKMNTGKRFIVDVSGRECPNPIQVQPHAIIKTAFCSKSFANLITLESKLHLV